MNLEEKINADLKSAMLAKDEPAVRGLRAIKQAILLAKTSGGGSIHADEELKMLQKLVKQRKESVDIYIQQNREDLAAPEKEEIAVIEKYLPAQMSEDEVRLELKNLIGSLGDVSAKDMGKIMGLASKHFAGKADNKLVSQILREILK
ncbi:MAG: GatB/YqeY domain-containing protein [Bacteroidetes bacterium]|nr:MAG: GatB/YqeY domain-containing protein [Bacteroidota bacterium]REK03495.1 MAG: GatB/YqeY domain-containing protein [Bacteroidota bacterium]REK34800.1 MAG: GatB/YqeY domain-containing protein [Bacteroidota bacterium]